MQTSGFLPKMGVRKPFVAMYALLESVFHSPYKFYRNPFVVNKDVHKYRLYGCHKHRQFCLQIGLTFYKIRQNITKEKTF